MRDIQSPDLLPAEIDRAWHEVMRGNVTAEDVTAARTMIADDPRLGLLEPPGADVERVRLEVIARLGRVPAEIDVRGLALELRLIAMLKTVALAEGRRAAAHSN